MMLPKPSRTARKLAKREGRAETVRLENKEKAKVRKRDGGCRFPMCGCKKMGMRAEVSHDEHKGWNGQQTKRERSVSSKMVQMCDHRHQFGAVSRHKGTLRTEFLTENGYDGPVAWSLNLFGLWPVPFVSRQDEAWFEVARESAPGRLLPCTDRQTSVLRELAKMTDY